MVIRCLFLCCCILLNVVVTAQTSIRPVLRPGDTVYLSRDLLPHPIEFADTGADLYWDMSRLLSPFVHQSLVRPDGTEGLVLMGTDDVDRYMVDKSDGLYITRLGLPDGTGGRTIVHIDPPVPFVRYLDLDDTWEYKGTITLNSTQSGRPVKFSLAIRAEVDASGELYSPTARYDVVRERRDIELILMPSGVVTKHTEPGLPTGFTTGRTYLFISAASAMPVAVVQTDAMNQAKQVEYLTHPWAGTVIQQLPRRPDVFVYPNPSFGNVRFDFLNLSSGYYDLEIYNILGSKIRTEYLFINGIRTLPLDLTRLKKGTYIYRLVDSEKNTIRSKRLVIITP
jgi:hypothetical protein